jgi:hypothetical protein
LAEVLSFEDDPVRRGLTEGQVGTAACECGDAALALRLADHDEVRVVALGSDLRECLEQVRETLHRHVRAGGGHEASGDPCDPGARTEDVGIDPDRDDVQAIGRHTHLLDDVVA